MITKIQDSEFRQFGLNKHQKKMCEDLVELREDKPKIIIVECKMNAIFDRNKFQTQNLKKKQKYVMSVGMYAQLKEDPSGNKILKPTRPLFNNIYKPYNGESLDNKTLLVSRTGGIGDLLFIQPNLIYLKEKYPSCKIIFAVSPLYQSMIESWDCVDQILDLPHTMKWLVQADYHAYFEGVIERCKESHNTNCYNLFSRWMGLDLADELLIPYQIPEEDKVNYCKKYLKDNNIDKFVMIQLRASSPIRTPNLKLWKKVIEKLDYKVIITDTPRNKENLDKFIKHIGKDNVYNFSSHSKTLDYSIALCSLASCVVGTDSSMIHIAASLRTPAVGLYGPFPGHIRLSTYKNVKWIDVKKKCAPCFQHGVNPCLHSTDGFSNCYDNLNIDELINLIKEAHHAS